MSGNSDGRRSERQSFEVSLALVLATGSLEGEAMDLSREGILIKAKGKITMLLQLNGQEYRGRLVRATPLSENETAYAIEFNEPMDGIEATAPSST